MMWIALLLALGASPEVWVVTPPSLPEACRGPALANALHVLRPDLPVHTEGQAPTGALVLTLGQNAGQFSLRLDGPEVSLTRPLPGNGVDCETTLRAAALIVDGALDELPDGGESPRIDPLRMKPPRSFELGLSVNGSAGQGLLGAAGYAGAGLYFRRGLLEVGASGDVALPQSLSVVAAAPPFTYSSIGGDLEIEAGVAPRLGPGHLFADGGVGLSLTHAQVGNTPMLFQFQGEMAEELFLSVRAGYRLDLPRHFFLTALVAERFAPQHASFVVEGTNSQVTTRTWTVLGTLGAGWRFF